MSDYANLEFIDEPEYQHGFPWRNICSLKAEKEYQSLIKKIKKSNPIFPLSCSHTGYACTDRFFQYERLSTNSDTNMSAIQYWNQRKEKIMSYYNTNNYKKDLFGTIVFMKRVPSHFSPFIAAMIYKYFNAKKILDPYSGWGDRCLAAMAMNITYIGIDSNPNLVFPYKQLISWKYNPNIYFISGKTPDVIPTGYTPDLIFSSPPFWTSSNKLLEYYTNTDKDINHFLKYSLYPLMHKYINKVPIALYINEHMYNMIIKEFEPPKTRFQFYSSCAHKNKKKIYHTIYCWI